ncbi:MAG: hypothetical protein ACFE8J_16845 [Candidatus Heimdallarchaeota archaeon]
MRSSSSGYFKDFSILLGWDFLGNFEDEINHELIKIIDIALIESFGYPAYLSLITGILSITGSEKGDFNFDFLLHDEIKQGSLINNWDLRPLYYPFGVMKDEKLGTKEIIGNSEYHYPAIIFASFLISGFYHIAGEKALEFKIHESSSFFIRNFFSKYQPILKVHYRDIYENFLESEFSNYLNPIFIDKLNTLQRGIISKFIFKLLDKTLELAESCGLLELFDIQGESDIKRTSKLAKLFLSQYIDDPKSGAYRLYDFVKDLRDIYNSGHDGVITINPDSTYLESNKFLSSGFNIIVPYSELSKLIKDNPQIITTFSFHYAGHGVMDTSSSSSYRLDFDYLWSLGLDDKVLNTFFKLTQMFLDENGEIRQEIKDFVDSSSTKKWKVVFYTETADGIQRMSPYMFNPDTRSSSKIYYTEFDPKSKSGIYKAIANILYYTTLIPRCFAVVKMQSRMDFLYYDSFGVHSHDYMLSSSGRKPYQGNHFWIDEDGYFSKEKYKEFIDSLLENEGNIYLSSEDIRYFPKFSPARGVERDIKYHMMDKFITLFMERIGRDMFPMLPNNLPDIIENLYS